MAEEEFSVEELNLLHRVARALLKEQDYGELLAGLLDATIEGLGADRGFVVVRDAAVGSVAGYPPRSGQRSELPAARRETRRASPPPAFRAAVARNFRSDSLAEAEQEVSTSISSAVMAGGGALLLSDALDSERFGENPSVRRLGLRSVLCAPVLASSDAFALLYLENRNVTHRFTERHRQLLDEICALAAPRLRVAVAIEHARKRARELEPAMGGAEGLLTADPAMAAVLETARQVAATDLPVLVQGETGTGKELVARALYRHSPRAHGAFVVLNCGAIPAGLIESELFGYARGAFTGAHNDRMGLIASAHRGTLFLDEVGEMPLDLQPRLLRVLQSGEFTRLGLVRPETVDIRCIAATNRDLEREVEAGRFRSDLFFRLAAITLKIPPLRDRPHDVRLLADHFVRAYAVRYGREAPGLGGDFLEALEAYSFPGNVRELESEMARLVAVSPPGALLEPVALNDRIRNAGRPVAAKTAGETPLAAMSLAEMEKRLILAVLENTEGNRTRAAEVLGISREGLRTKMQRLGLSDS